MGAFEDRDYGFSHGGASRRGTGGGSGWAGRWILADFVAHFFGDITQTLGHRFAPPESFDAPVQEADPAEQQVRVVAHREGGSQ